MTFYQLTKNLWEIIDDIANDLIATAAWQEGDATWTTAVKTAENARRVVQHIADGMYLSLIQSNTQRQAGAQAYYAKGLIVVFSDGWNAGAHTPSGNIHIVYVPFEGKSATGVNADLAAFAIPYSLFTGSGGFALVGVPPINATDNYQSNFIVVVERNTAKLYADGYTNFYILADGNYINVAFNDYDCGAALFGVAVRWWRYTHPFHIQSHGTSAVPIGYDRAYNAFKSIGDGKAYFMKPVLHNEITHVYPWLQPEFWIAIDSTKVNLADGDEIAMPAPATKKYMVTLKQSPDSATYIYYAIIETE
jgi:hypothetical protein